MTDSYSNEQMYDIAMSDEDMLQQLQLLQIQYEEMIHFSSHLAGEKNSLMAQNQELTEVIEMLKESTNEDSRQKSEMKGEIYDLKQELNRTKIELKKATLSRDCLGSQQGKRNRLFRRSTLIRPAVLNQSVCESKTRRNSRIQQIASKIQTKSKGMDGLSASRRLRMIHQSLMTKNLGDNPLLKSIPYLRRSVAECPEKSENDRRKTARSEV